MTTLISWVGIDSRQPASIYLASDSRISWWASTTWDSGKKLFSTKHRPEIYGFCGDVTFLHQSLGQLCDLIDSGVIFSDRDSFEHKLDVSYQHICESVKTYPKNLLRDFQVLYISRIESGMAAQFFAGSITWTRADGLMKSILPLPETSGLIEKAGSGRNSIHDWHYRWQKSDVKGTSRSVFGAFCDSLQSNDDPMSGGAPQLIGLYRTGQPHVFGLVWEGQRYLSGSMVPELSNFHDVEWRNSKFERCDPITMLLIEDAQPQPRPNIR